MRRTTPVSVLLILVLIGTIYAVATEIPEHIYRSYINASVGVVIGLILAYEMQERSNGDDVMEVSGRTEEEVCWSERMARGKKALWAAVNGELLTEEEKRWAAEALADIFGADDTERI